MIEKHAQAQTTSVTNPPLVQQGEKGHLLLSGNWTVHTLPLAERSMLLAGVSLKKLQNTNYIFDISGVKTIDTSGVLFINRYRARKRLTSISEESVKDSSFFQSPILNPSKAQEDLFNLCAMPEFGETSPAHSELKFVKVLRDLGQTIVHMPKSIEAFANFFGLFIIASFNSILKPWSIRFTSLVYHIGQAGIGAVPIVAMLALLIGMVLAYMTSSLLAEFGAEIFVVKLLEVGIFREMGVLITAILVAGRSGASFTAQVGAMVANQEVDAMRSMGIDPFKMLVLPRVFGLMVSLPLLTLIANIMGIIGGMTAVWISLDLKPVTFMTNLQANISLTNFMLGFIKAPCFAIVIGLIGCYRGFQVTGSAESVGLLTTRSVVESIFLVIALDAAFALIFMQMGI